MANMPKLEVVNVKVGELLPYINNAKKHPQEQVEQIAKSIEELGFNDPVAVWHNENGDMEIVEGHGRVQALKHLGMEDCPVIFLDHMTDEQRRAYVHIHNKLTMNSDFDMDILSAELQSLGEFDEFDLGEFGFDFELEDIGEEEEDPDDPLSPAYSDNVGKVIYEPKETNHSVSDLFYYDRDDLDELVAGIEDEELRHMLELRKAWFTEFNFAKVADYYAYQATPKEQRVFEALGMVLLDKDQLIENGFARIVEGI